MIPDIKRILYTTDLSQNAAHAFRYALSFAKKFDAEIVLLHVLEEISEDAKIVLEAYIDKKHRKELAQKREAQALERLNSRVKAFCENEYENDPECAKRVASIEVCKGYPEEEILKKAEILNCDAIIMGAHEKGFTHTFLGNVAKRVLRRSRKPVFMIPLPKGKTDLAYHDD